MNSGYTTLQITIYVYKFSRDFFVLLQHILSFKPAFMIVLSKKSFKISCFVKKLQTVSPLIFFFIIIIANRAGIRKVNAE